MDAATWRKIVFDLAIAALMVGTGTINTLAAKWVLYLSALRDST